MEDFGFKFWLKMAGLFVLGAIALFIFMWIFLSAIYAWGFFAAMLVLAVGALALGWIHDRRNGKSPRGQLLAARAPGAADASSRRGHAPDERSAVADAIGGAAAYSARVAARVWRGPLEAAAEELLSTPEVRRAADRTLSGPLPEELGRLLVRHRVVERVVHELVVSGELERMLETTLASPQSQAMVDRVLASPAMQQSLERVLAGPEVRAALKSQTAGFADEVVSGARETASGFDSRLSLRAHAPLQFAGVASRGVALVVDAFAVVAATAVVGGAASLVGAVVGGVRPDWLAQALLSVAAIVIAVGYFVVFWQTTGQTPGMRLMGVRVLSRRNNGPVDRVAGAVADSRPCCSRSSRASSASSRPCSIGGAVRSRTTSRAPWSSTTTRASVTRRDAGGDTPPDGVAGKARRANPANLIERRLTKFLHSPPSVRLAANVIVTATWSSWCSAA